jgi:hypothetical protein
MRASGTACCGHQPAHNNSNNKRTNMASNNCFEHKKRIQHCMIDKQSLNKTHTPGHYTHLNLEANEQVIDSNKALSEHDVHTSPSSR